MDDTNIYVDFVLENLPGSEHRLHKIRAQLQEDTVCIKGMAFCDEGWPDKSKLKVALKLHWAEQAPHHTRYIILIIERDNASDSISDEKLHPK